MPELPEVETVRRDLSRLFVGQTLQHMVVTGPRTVRRHPPDLLAALEGRALVDMGRRGKYLIFEWDDGQVLVAHLRMSGQLLACPVGAATAAHTHAVLHFEDGRELRFVDPRTFGEFFLATSSLVELGHIGPDALVAGPAHLGAALAGRRAPLKALLVDQRVLAGIGSIYADEICFAARVRPFRPGGSLRPREVARLAGSVSTVLEAAIEARGSTLGDQQYRDVHGQVGGFQLEHRVYGRRGLPCLSCGTPVERVELGAKSAYLCRKCQR
jgi:formamidopyrimidine-DNA glycosylase